MRSESLHIRVTEYEMDIFRAAARSADRSVSDWIRLTLKGAAGAAKRPAPPDPKSELCVMCGKRPGAGFPCVCPQCTVRR